MFEKVLEIAFRSVVMSVATAIAGPIGTIVVMTMMPNGDNGSDASNCDASV